MTLLETQLHPQMRAFESQPLIETMRVFPRLMGCQLNDVSTTRIGTFDCPFHHLASNSLVLMLIVYTHRFDLCAEPTLKTDRREKHQMESSDHLPIQFGND